MLGKGLSSGSLAKLLMLCRMLDMLEVHTGHGEGACEVLTESR